jgi:hypothetical protein
MNGTNALREAIPWVLIELRRFFAVLICCSVASHLSCVLHDSHLSRI